MTAPAAQPQREHESKFPHLERPPIQEVVCGFVFEPILSLDEFEFGVYWDSRRDEYPDKQMRLGLLDGAPLEPSARAWLVSPNDGPLVQQLQNSRFYLNWRRRPGGAYPRFSDREGQPGLCSKAMAEFERFSEFCRSRPTVATSPVVQHIELTKVDVLERDREWSTLEQLGELLPITQAFTTNRQSNQIQLALSEREQFPGGWLRTQINASNDSREDLASIRLESRISLVLEGDLRATFARANARLNDVFFQLIPDAVQRFGTRGDHA